MPGKHARVRILRSPTGLVAAGAVAVVLLGVGTAGAMWLGPEQTTAGISTVPAGDAATTTPVPSAPASTAATPAPTPSTAAPSQSPQRASRSEDRSTARPTPTRSTPSKRPAATKRPTSSRSPEQVVETGSCGASYYDQGLVTANGESFDPDGLTAAHRTLPFDTRVRVTNPANGKSVVVRINDRGPFVDGRCIDLSRGAFEAIASLSVGEMDVRYEVLG